MNDTEPNRTRTGDRGRFAIFRAEAAVALTDTDITNTELPPGVVGNDGSHALGYGGGSKVLLRQSEDDGFSLVYVWFKPNYILPRHSHNADCLYYVISGAAILGCETLGPGDGFYVPADAPYAYRAGSEGVELLEFRCARSFDTTFSDVEPEGWQAIFDNAKANQERWAAMSDPSVGSMVAVLAEHIAGPSLRRDRPVSAPG